MKLESNAGGTLSYDGGMNILKFDRGLCCGNSAVVAAYFGRRSRHHWTRLLASVAACFALVGSAAHAQRAVIEISGATFRPMPVALPAPMTADESARAVAAEFDDALQYDIGACGLFKLLDRTGYLAPAGEGVTLEELVLDAWKNIGADSLIKVRLSAEGTSLRGDLYMYSPTAGTQIMRAQASAPTTEPRRVAHALANEVYRYFTHETGPFQTRLAFSRKSAKGRDIWVSDWDGQYAKQVTRDGLDVLPALRSNLGVAYTSYRPRGAWLYFDALRGTPPVELVKRGSMVAGVAYTVSGDKLAVSVAEGQNAEIFVGNADGSNLTPITNTRYFLNTSPSWSPDGKSLAFVSNRGGNPQVYVMAADGTGVRRLTFQGKYNTTPAFSPRGDSVAFTGRDENNRMDIYAVELAQGKVTRLTQNAGSNEEPAYSPTGRHIVFTSDRLGSRRMYVMTNEGNNQTALRLRNFADEATPSWGP